MTQRRAIQRQIYEDWMEKEGVPIYQAQAGIEDIIQLPRRPWARRGGKGTFIRLEGTKEAHKELYVVEIPSGAALEPEKHLYYELLYILQGRGLSEVWSEGQGKVTFEWGEGSLFAIPLNAWHRLVNGGREPVLVFGLSNAPAVIESLRNTEFIFKCPYNFAESFTGQTDYFLPGEKRFREGGIMNYWETNFVPDVRTTFLDDQFEKVESGQLTRFKMAAWTQVHSSEWPVGIYHKAHYHGPGAVLLGLKSEGYVMLWPRRYGIHPYQDGHGDKVAKINWKKNSIYSPGPGETFHAHFNTGREPARHLGVPGGGLTSSLQQQREFGTMISLREGGQVLEYEDEDPEVRRMFQKDLQKNGVKFAMKPVVYRTDPFKFDD